MFWIEKNNLNRKFSILLKCSNFLVKINNESCNWVWEASVLRAALHHSSLLCCPSLPPLRRGGTEDERTDGRGREGEQIKTNVFFVFTSFLQTDK